VASLSYAISPPPPQQPKGQEGSALDKEADEWEIVRIIEKRHEKGRDQGR